MLFYQDLAGQVGSVIRVIAPVLLASVAERDYRKESARAHVPGANLPELA